MTVAREDLGLEAAFWAQLPGNFADRPRKAPITSRNFAAHGELSQLPRGRATGNHWGDALALLMTSSRSPYYFSLARHRSQGSGRAAAARTRAIPSSADRRDRGRPSSSASCWRCFPGKASRRSCSTRTGDLRSWCGRSGGTYLPLKNGAPTGFNPLQLPPTRDEHRIPEGLAPKPRPRDPLPLGVREEADLDHALARHARARARRAAAVSAASSSPMRRAPTASMRASRAGAQVRAATTPGRSTTRPTP